MADLSISQILQNIMGVADKNNNKTIEEGEERSIFDREVKKYNLTDAQEQNLYAILGLELGSTEGARKAPRKANGVVINVDASTNIDININITMDIKKLVEDLITNFNGKIDEVIAKMAEDNKNIVQIVAALLEQCKGDNAALMAILKGISNHVENSDDTLKYMKFLLEQILDKQLDFYNKVEGWDIGKMLQIIAGKQDNQTEYMEDIYAAITKLGEERKEDFNILMQKFEAGEVKFDEVIALLQAINADTSANKEISKQILAKSEEILAAIKEIGLDIKSIDESTKNMLVQLLAQGKDMTDIKELLKAMKTDIEEGNGISREILETIKNLGNEIIPQLTAIYNKIGTGGGGGGITKEQFEKLLEAINKNTDAVNNNTEVSIQNKKDIIAAIEKLGVDMIGGFNAVLEAIQNGDEASALLLEKLLEAVNNNTEVSKENAAAIIEAIEKLGVKLGDKIDNLDLTVSEGIDAILAKIEAGQKDYSEALQKILDALNKLDGDVNNNFATVITLIGQKPDVDLTALLQKFDENNTLLDKILNAIQDHDVHVTVDVTGKVTCECNCGGGHNNEGVEVKELQGWLDEAFNGGSNDDADSIKTLPEQISAGKVVYDLSGRKVTEVKPGNVYIVDGKKVLYR